MFSVSCSGLCYIWLTNWPAPTASIMLYYCNRAGLLMQSKWDYVSCWVSGVDAGVSSPDDTACTVLWLSPVLSKGMAAGGCAGLALKESRCVRRAVCCCASARSLRGVCVGLALPVGWQPGRSSVNFCFPLPFIYPKDHSIHKAGWKLCQHRWEEKMMLIWEEGETSPTFLGQMETKMFLGSLFPWGVSADKVLPGLLWWGSRAWQSLGMWNHIFPSSCLRWFDLYTYY